MPQLIDIFTSAGSPTWEGFVPKRVFAPGESIQWNVIHRPLDGEIGRQYEIRYFLEHLSLTIAHNDDDDFELLWPIKATVLQRTAASLYRGEGPRHSRWWLESITDYGDTLPLPAGERPERLRAIRDDRELLFVRGFWRLTVFVELTEAATGRPFDVAGEWIYRIVD